MIRIATLGQLAAAFIFAAALACSSDSVISPSANTTGAVPEAAGSGTGDSSSTVFGNPGTPGPPGTVAIIPATAAVELHYNLALKAVQYDADGKPVVKPAVWSSSNVDIATVGDTGLVHGAGVGAVTIHAAIGDQTLSATVTVVDSALVSPPPAPPSDSGLVGDSVLTQPPDSTPPSDSASSH